MAFLGCSPLIISVHHLSIITTRQVAGGSPKKSHPSMANVSTQILGKERHIVVIPQKR